MTPLERGAFHCLIEPLRQKEFMKVLEGAFEIIHLQEAKRQTELALYRIQKRDAIGQFSNTFSHEFNNILGIILGNAELLEQRISDDNTAHQMIHAIKQSTQQAANLSKQLFQFPHNHSEQVEVIKINHVIGEMDNLISVSFTSQVEFEYDLAEDLWWTKTDTRDFQNIMFKLIRYAIDAIRGCGSLTNETNNRTLDAPYCLQNPGIKEGEYIDISISNSGGHILAEEQKHIIEPFHNTKKSGNKTNLGLASAHSFALHYRGQLKVFPETGHRTLFRLYLPRAENSNTN